MKELSTTVNHSRMFDREKVFAFDVAEAIETCIDLIDSGFPKAVHIDMIASQLADMKFIDGDGQMAHVPADVKKSVKAKYLSLLDSSIDTVLLSYGYELYAEKHKKLVVPVADTFFGVLNGADVLDCLDALTEKETFQSLPRRNNPTVGILVFNHEQQITPLVALWYQRQTQNWAGQRVKLQEMRDTLPHLKKVVRTGNFPVQRRARDILADEE